MRKVLLAAAALVAVSSSSALAEVWVEAGAQAGYYSEPQFNFSDIYGSVWARFLVRTPSGFSMDLGGQVGHGSPSNDPDYTFAGLDADLFYANAQFAAGVYLGTFRTSDGYSNGYYGLQGNYFLSRMDIGAWIGRETNGFGDDNTNVGAFLAYYLNPNTAVGGRLWWEGDDYWSKHAVGAFVEHRFSRPFSIWADAEFGRYSDPMIEFNSWETNIGVTWFYDPAGTSLQDHYHTMPF